MCERIRILLELVNIILFKLKKKKSLERRKFEHTFAFRVHLGVCVSVCPGARVGGMFTGNATLYTEGSGHKKPEIQPLTTYNHTGEQIIVKSDV